jgi:hypothetical protein
MRLSGGRCTPLNNSFSPTTEATPKPAYLQQKNGTFAVVSSLPIPVYTPKEQFSFS